MAIRSVPLQTKKKIIRIIIKKAAMRVQPRLMKNLIGEPRCNLNNSPKYANRGKP